ncbi:MAG: hypothetical protein ACRD40_10225 [Candidatus Acidiferrales bacterium]
MSRLIIGLAEILCGTKLENKEAIKGIIGHITMYCLMSAFMSLRDLRKTANDPTIPVLTKMKHFEDMSKSLWAAYKDRTQQAAKLMGYDIGFLFQNDSDFMRCCAGFSKIHPKVNPHMLVRMKFNRINWQNEFARFRNQYLEHQTVTSRQVAAYYSLDRAEMLFANVW